MTYHYTVMRNGLLLKRTLTHGMASKVAARNAGAIVVAALYLSGCAHVHHTAVDVPCDASNCGKSPNGGK